MLFLGIDVSKDKLDGAIVSEDTGAMLGRRSFPNSADGVKCMRRWAETIAGPTKPAAIHAVVKATAAYHELAAHDLAAAGVGVSIANPQEKTTRSIANILNAYKVARTFLTREFGENPTAIRVFYGYLTNKVKLIRIQTENVAKTLKVFETRHLELRCSTGFSTTYKSVVIISGSLNVYPGGSASGRSSQAF